MAHKILVVDDERDHIELMCYNLVEAGYEVLSAEHGMDALHKARRFLPDLILLDLMLPDFDGFSICEILRCQPSTARIPIIMLTAMAGEFPRLHGLEAGAMDCLCKPVLPSELVRRVRSVLEARPAQVAASEARHADPAAH